MTLRVKQNVTVVTILNIEEVSEDAVASETLCKAFLSSLHILIEVFAEEYA